MEDRLKALEAKVAELEARITLEECRWSPKIALHAVFATGGSTWSQEKLIGVFSTKEHAEAKAARSDQAETYRVEEILLDAG